MAGSFHSMVLDVPDLRDFTVTTFRDTVVLVGGQHPQGKCSDQVMRFDWKTKSWEQLPVLPLCLSGHGAVVYDGELWIAGGIPDHAKRKLRPEVSSAVFSFDGSRWESRGHMNTARFKPKLVVDPFRGFLTVLGGHDQLRKAVRCCEAYNRKTSWRAHEWVVLGGEMDDFCDMI